MEENYVQLEIWMVVILVGILTWGFLVRQRKSGRGLKLLPGPRAWPIVGCLPFLPSLYPRELMLAKLAEKHGELMLLWMGTRKTVVVSSARMAMEVLKTHDHEFANRPNPIAFQYISFHGTELTSMSHTHPLFRPTRRMFAAEIVSPRKVAMTGYVRKEQVLNTLSAVVQDLDAGRCVNFTKAMSSLAMNLALCMNFGRDFGEKVVDDAEILVRTFNRMVVLVQRRNVGDYFPAIRWLDAQGIEAGLKEVEVQLRQSITALIERKKLEMSMWSTEEIKTGANERDIMSKLLSKEGADRFSEEHLISVVFTLLIAGTETIGKVVTAAMREILRNPHIYKRTIAELDAVVGTRRLVEESDIAKLPLLQNIIKETLRLHPPAPILLPHKNFEACEVGGYYVPANSVALVNLYPIMRDPDFWDSPMEFSPDRWNDMKLKMQGSDFHYIPFGYGKRQCPGMNLGLRTVQYALAVCLQCLKWEIAAGMERRENHNIATAQEPRKEEDLVLEGKLRVDRSVMTLNYPT